jgi:hypothetical protein
VPHSLSDFISCASSSSLSRCRVDSDSCPLVMRGHSSDVFSTKTYCFRDFLVISSVSCVSFPSRIIVFFRFRLRSRGHGTSWVPLRVAPRWGVSPGRGNRVRRSSACGCRRAPPARRARSTASSHFTVRGRGALGSSSALLPLYLYLVLY